MKSHFLPLSGLLCALSCSVFAFAQNQPVVHPGVRHIDPAAAAVVADQKSLADDPKAKITESHKEQFVLRFIAKEIEGGHVINTREYSVRTYADSTSFDDAQIRTGGRVPVPTGKDSSQFSYIDVGINFDCHHIRIVDGHLNMQVGADISTYKEASIGAQPIIQQNKWQGSVTIAIGKTANIFSSDDVVSKRTIQIDLTVNRA